MLDRPNKSVCRHKCTCCQHCTNQISIRISEFYGLLLNRFVGCFVGCSSHSCQVNISESFCFSNLEHVVFFQFGARLDLCFSVFALLRLFSTVRIDRTCIMNRLRFLETDPVVAGCNSHDEIIPLYVLQVDAIGAWRVLHELFCVSNA